MDLIATLRNKIESLDEGEYMPGLKAVLLHIETAFRHLARGQSDEDDTAYTDSVYRTNQAFEGSIKEAYRVLAGMDPAKKRPFDIENYLEQNNIFRTRVLSRLTNYRTEWRNPSAHDYKLDFDESESFLAIVSVCAFACLLIDQISEKLAFNEALAHTEESKANSAPVAGAEEKRTLLLYVAKLLVEFSHAYIHSPLNSEKHSEVQLIGAIHGYLASVAPELDIKAYMSVGGQMRFMLDMLIARGDEKLVIEVKRRAHPSNITMAVSQIMRYLNETKVTQGIVFAPPDHSPEMSIIEAVVAGGRTVTALVVPSDIIAHTEYSGFQQLKV